MSSHATTNASSTMQIKVGFVHPCQLHDSVRYRGDLQCTHQTFRPKLPPSSYGICDPPKASNPRYVTCIGTIRCHQHIGVQNDGFGSEDVRGQESEALDDDEETKHVGIIRGGGHRPTPRSFSLSPDLTSTTSPTVSLPPIQQGCLNLTPNECHDPDREKYIPGLWHAQKCGAFELEADNDIMCWRPIVLRTSRLAPHTDSVSCSKPYPHLIRFKSDVY